VTQRAGEPFLQPLFVSELFKLDMSFEYAAYVALLGVFSCSLLTVVHCRQLSCSSICSERLVDECERHIANT
jgi:hypothetical protein